ncbi:MAG: GTP-binding protein [Candidatus Heimdallarchaeota archaeon]|nr:GTP-binding protein [Candidatus Heimdallarchaeota archaeon]
MNPTSSSESDEEDLVNGNSLTQDPIRYQFKIILLGDGGSGKTCLVNQFCYNLFKDTEITIGLTFNSYSIPARESGRKFRIGLSIWDFGGQQRFKPLLPQFITGANGALLVHDLTSYRTLVNLENEWFPLLRENVGQIPIVLVGTKSDLIINDFEVDEESIESFREKIGAVTSFPTSSVTGLNIDNAFKLVVQEILKNPPYDKRNIEIL